MPKTAIPKLKMSVAVALVVIGGGLLACAGAGKSSQSGDSTISTGSEQGPAPRPSYHIPVAADFVLDVQVLKQSCFGSAGCNITYRVNMTYQGAGPLDPDVTYEVTYQIKGAQDAKIATITATGTGN